MDAQCRTSTRRALCLAAVVFLGLAATQTVEASALCRPRTLPRAQQALRSPLNVRNIAQNSLSRRIENYYGRALAARSTRATRMPGMQAFLVANADGLLPDNSVVEYLRWRRSLNPARFDYYHPWMGSLLRRDQLARVTPCTPTVPSVPITPDGNPPPIVITTPPSPQVPIPEPSTLMLGIVMTGSMVWLHRRRGASREASG